MYFCISLLSPADGTAGQRLPSPQVILDNFGTYALHNNYSDTQLDRRVKQGIESKAVTIQWTIAAILSCVLVLIFATYSYSK